MHMIWNLFPDSMLKTEQVVDVEPSTLITMIELSLTARSLIVKEYGLIARPPAGPLGPGVHPDCPSERWANFINEGAMSALTIVLSAIFAVVTAFAFIIIFSIELLGIFMTIVEGA